MVGSKGETGEHDCPADRSKGATDECSFKDTTSIGTLKEVRIKNKSDGDIWVFASISVRINGVRSGRWKGRGWVNDQFTVSFTYTGIKLLLMLYQITH